jgi:hypothetical protein
VSQPLSKEEQVIVDTVIGETKEMGLFQKIKTLFAVNRIAGEVADVLKAHSDKMDMLEACQKCEIALAVISQVPEEHHTELLSDIIKELKKARKLAS